MATNKTSCLDGDVAYLKSGGDVEREERERERGGGNGKGDIHIDEEGERERKREQKLVGRWWTEKYQDNADVRICRQ